MKPNQIDKDIAINIFGWKETKFQYIWNLPSNTCFSQSTTFGCQPLMPPDFIEKESPEFRFEPPKIPKYSSNTDLALSALDKVFGESGYALHIEKVFMVNQATKGVMVMLNKRYRGYGITVAEAICVALLRRYNTYMEIFDRESLLAKKIKID